MKSLIQPDKLVTSMKSNTILVKESTKITKSVSFFNSFLQSQLSVENTISSISTLLAKYGLISTSGDTYINIEQIGPLLGTDSVANQGFGFSVDLSEDGNTMVVGGCGILYDGTYATPDPDFDGAFWIYVRNETSWSLQTGPVKNIGSGSSVSLSSDGNTVAIGSFGLSNETYIYTRSGENWTLDQSFDLGLEGLTGEQGLTVSLSGDGKTVAFADGNWYIIIYVKIEDNWVKYRDVLYADLNTDGVGISPNLPVNISSDGSTIAFSGSNAREFRGQTRIFIKDGAGDWVFQGDPLDNPNSSTGDREGASAALSANGNILVTGAIQGNESNGKAFFYERDNFGVWSFGGEIPISGLGASRFGSGVSISGDGNVISVGGFGDSTYVGAIWIFYRNGNSYTLTNKFRGSGNLNSTYRGLSVNISGDGTTLAFGGPFYSNEGAVWVYISPTTTLENFLPVRNKLLYYDDFLFSFACNTLITETLLATDKISFFGVKPSTQLTSTLSVNSVLTVLQTYGLASTINVWDLSDVPLVGTNGTYDGTISSLQGSSVALSFNGETAVVGGPFYNNLTVLGGVWIFIKIKGIWSQQIGPLTDTSTGISEQGYSVSISSNGNTVAVGGPSFRPVVGTGTDPKGAAYVYVRTGNLWTSQSSGPLIAAGTGDAEATGQGRAVSLSENGNTLLVSGNTKLIGTARGAIWFYARTGTNWAETDGPIQPVETPEVGNFGWSAALSADGLTAVVGDPDWNGTGAIWIYENSTPGTPGGWLKIEGPLVSPTSLGNDSNQGYSVCISRDGSTIGVGSPTDYNNRGTFYVYFKNSGVWGLQAGPLIGSAPTSGSLQGSSISISSGGNQIVSGGPGNNADAGAYWTFLRTNGIWTQSGIQVSLSDETSIKFGSSIAISSDGRNVLIGALGYGNTGAAFNATAVV
jgi:hypothetical protein